MYARKFRKQTKKWDVIPIKEHKTYSYIPDILQEIETIRTSTPRCDIKRKRPVPAQGYVQALQIQTQILQIILSDAKDLALIS